MLLVSDITESNYSFSYSNTNYLLLEKVVKIVTVKTYKSIFNYSYSTYNLSNIKIEFEENGYVATTRFFSDFFILAESLF